MSEDSIEDQITRFLRKSLSGQPARDAVAKRVYHELYRLANLRVRDPRSTLSPTALVHEAWLKLSDQSQWEDRRHFYAVAAVTIRNTLVDHLRGRARLRRGGGVVARPLDDDAAALTDEDLPDLLLDLDEALRELAEVDAELAQVTDLRLMLQLEHEEVAELIGTSSRTAERRWRAARAWLQRRLQGAREE